MSEEMIVRYCSPTLAGMKTGSLYSDYCESEKEMRTCVLAYNRKLVKKGLRVIPLRYHNKRVLIYVYRPCQLANDLQDGLANRLLKNCGYQMNDGDHCVIELMKRLSDNNDFPHEIGLFLGYPPIDVHGFIENKSLNCKCVGCWKVYGDEQEAKKMFDKYKKCSEVYCSLYAKGKSIEGLSVTI